MIFLFLGIPAPVVLLSFNSLHSYPDCVLTSDCMILEFVKYQPLVTTSTHVLVFYYIPLVYMSVFAITILFVGRDCFGYLVFVLFHINFRTFFSYEEYCRDIVWDCVESINFYLQDVIYHSNNSDNPLV